MPLSELDLAVRAFQDRGRPVRLDPWRRQVLLRSSAPTRMAMSLIPPIGWSPGFLCPVRAGSPEELLEQVRATPPAVIRADLAAVAEQQTLPNWARQLPDDASLRNELYDGLGRLYADLMDPFWERLSRRFTVDRTVRTRQLLTGGVECLLAQANPQWMRWKPPVLEIRMPNGVDHDLRLEGQGIVLVPSVFGVRSIVDNSPREQPTVTYPVQQEQPLDRLTAFAPESTAPTSARALGALLGRTRAVVLRVIAEHPGCSTKDLASLTGLAPASASEHATVLREAGLVITRRYRNTALHSLTGLGISLLNSAGG
ncbi:ArsR/SmtB family transcription factor [Streptomyces endocoffeicus]|nr:winged helix-turn-helix domain-containing protein [Streptomyces endocoffeicus]